MATAAGLHMGNRWGIQFFPRSRIISPLLDQDLCNIRVYSRRAGRSPLVYDGRGLMVLSADIPPPDMGVKETKKERKNVKRTTEAGS